MASKISNIPLQYGQITSFDSHQAAKAVAEIFGPDQIAKHLSDEKPSAADAVVHTEAVKKSYYQLKSGRVVETLTMEGGKEQCVGSFTYTREECCIEGWAAYHPEIDKQWCALETAFLLSRGNPEFTQDEAENWSCGWNCIQNYLYLQTGKKFTVLELMDCYLQIAQERFRKTIEDLSSAKDPKTINEVIEKAIPNILLVTAFFDGEDYRFATNNLSYELLLGESRSATCDESDYENTIYYAPLKLREALMKTTSDRRPIILHLNDTEAHLLFSDPSGQLTLIDPHNLTRSPSFSSHRFVRDIVPVKKSLTFITQHLSGKTQTYREGSSAAGLGSDIDPRPLVQQLVALQAETFVCVETVSNKILALAAILEKCNTIFEEKTE